MHRLRQVLLPSISIPPTAITRPYDAPRLYFDGCSKGNPGPAGAGAHLLMPTEILKFMTEGPNEMRPYEKERDVSPEFREIWHGSEYLGDATNNESEYLAMILGLNASVVRKLRRLDVYGDSLLVINQMKGLYKVKSPTLERLCQEAHTICEHFDHVSFTHVLRDKNKRADELANRALKNPGMKD